MIKTLTDKDLVAIINHAVTNMAIDDADKYTAFLESIAQVVTTHFGGSAGKVKHSQGVNQEPVDFTIDIHLDDQVPADGGIYKILTSTGAAAVTGPGNAVLKGMVDLCLEMGHTIRSLDEGEHHEFWTNDGNYVPDDRFRAAEELLAAPSSALPAPLRVDLMYDSKKTPYHVIAEVSGDTGIYDELRVGYFRGVQCVGDAFFTVDRETLQPRVLLTSGGEGDGDHDKAWYPLRERNLCTVNFD